MVPEPLKVLVIFRRSSAVSIYWVLACTGFALVLGSRTAPATAATQTTAVIFFQFFFINRFGSFFSGWGAGFSNSSNACWPSGCCAGSLCFFRSIVSPLLYRCSGTHPRQYLELYRAILRKRRKISLRVIKTKEKCLLPAGNRHLSCFAYTVLNNTVMRKTFSGCSMRQTPCIFSIMVSMLVSPTLVLSEEAGMDSTRFSKHRPAMPFCCTKRT